MSNTNPEIEIERLTAALDIVQDELKQSRSECKRLITLLRARIQVLEGAVDVFADLVQFLEADIADGAELSVSVSDRLSECNAYMCANDLWHTSQAPKD